jgi:hypothetical protein
MLKFGVSSGISIFLLIENESRTKKKLPAIPSGIHSDHRNQRNFVSERISGTDPGHLVVFTPLASGGNAGLSVLKRYSMSAIISRAPKNRRNMAH